MDISRKDVGLLVIAILSGLATAAGIVTAMAVRAAAKSLASADRPAAAAIARPSPFGNSSPRLPSPQAAASPAAAVKGGDSSIVTVTGYDAGNQAVSRGTGFIYSSNGIVVTTYGAIRGASSVVVETASGEELSVIALMAYSPARNLAALAVLEGNLASLQNGAEETVQEGEAVTVPGSATPPCLLGMRRAIGGVDLIGLSCTANAGSPVIDGRGKVIGVAANRAGASFAVPIHYISDMLAESHAISFDQMLAETQTMGPRMHENTRE